MLSDSTEDYDRGKKFERYRALATLTDYLLVAQDRIHVEQYARQSNGVWLFSEATKSEDKISIASIGCELLFEENYEKLTLNLL